jgi:hypothetical protein
MYSIVYEHLVAILKAYSLYENRKELKSSGNYKLEREIKKQS